MADRCSERYEVELDRNGRSRDCWMNDCMKIEVDMKVAAEEESIKLRMGLVGAVRKYVTRTSLETGARMSLQNRPWYDVIRCGQ